MNSRANVELEAVPGTHDMQLGLGKHHALAGAVFGDDLLDLGDHLALAGWAAHVRAMVEIGEELAAELEHGNLEILEADDLAAGIGDVGRRTDVHLTHIYVPCPNPFSD